MTIICTCASIKYSQQYKDCASRCNFRNTT